MAELSCIAYWVEEKYNRDTWGITTWIVMYPCGVNLTLTEFLWVKQRLDVLYPVHHIMKPYTGLLRAFIYSQYDLRLSPSPPLFLSLTLLFSHHPRVCKTGSGMLRVLSRRIQTKRFQPP